MPLDGPYTRFWPIFLMRISTALLFCSMVTLSGCQQYQYYQQAIVGQSKLLLNRQSNIELQSKTEIDPALKYRLRLAQEILEFAEVQGLPANGAYDSYVATGQTFVIWNVFAAEPYTLALKSSCFPIAGCVSYRGFFGLADARKYAASLEEQGYETYIGGVTAYSTLGWFDDPLLDTFLFRPEEQLAALLFHELAHQLVYVKDDTRFNESFATAIERFLLKKWLLSIGDEHRFDRYVASQARVESVIGLVEQTRVSLRELYESGQSADDTDRKKRDIISGLILQYETLSQHWDEGSEYSHWMETPINNAKIETVADYHQWVPAMSAILEKEGFVGFRIEMHRLAKMNQPARKMALETYNSR